MRLNHSAVVSKGYVRRWNIKQTNDASSEKLTKKSEAASRASVGPKKVESDQKMKKAVWIVRREASRDASPVSVIFGVDRGQVFGDAAACATARVLLFLHLLLFLLCGFLLSRQAKKHENRSRTYS